MEQVENRVSWLSLLTDARQRLRSHAGLDAMLMNHSASLPAYDKDYCDTQESFQLGAGWAYRQDDTSEIAPETIYEAYFATKPTRWNLSEDYLAWEKQHIIAVALLLLDGEDLEYHQLDLRIDTYAAIELAAFIEGFTVTSDYFVRRTAATGMEA